jgi:hypothetical protein
VLSLVASLSSLCFGPIHTMVKDDIKAVVAKHKRPADEEAGQGGGSPPLLSRRQVSWWLLALALAVGLPCAAALWAVGSLDDRHGVALLVGVVLGGLLGALGAGAALAGKNYCPTRRELGEARETLAEYQRWAARRLVVLGPVMLIEVIHFFPIMIEHYVYGALDSRGYVGYLVAFNAPKLLFLLMLDKTSTEDIIFIYLLLVPSFALALPCGALLGGHGTIHDSRGAGLLAGVVIGGLIGLGFVLFMLMGHFKDDCFVRQHPGWAPVLVVMPLVPCVLAIEAGFKGDTDRQDAAKWNAHLLLIYMLTAYGSMGLMLRGGSAGLWTCCSLGTCYALLALIAAMWLGFPHKMTALTAEGGSVLDKLDSGGSGRSWQARLASECATLTELDMSDCKGLTSLPERLGECQQLQKLSLTGCSGLTSLSERLGECQHLKKLDLRVCSGLTSLPERLGECQQLKWLNLYGCGALTSLPDLSSLPDLNVKAEYASAAAKEWKKGSYKSYPPPPSQ